MGVDDVLAGLPPRQREMALLLGLGLAPSEIAASTGLSEWTVRTHIRRLGDSRGLTGLRSIAHWAVLNCHLGLVSSRGGRIGEPEEAAALADGERGTEMVLTDGCLDTVINHLDG